MSWIKLYNRLKGGWILFNKAAQWPIRILWVTKQKSSQRSLKATVGGWIEIWSTTDNAARHAAHRPAGWGLRLETDGLCAEGRPACQSVCTTSLPLRSPSRVGTGVNCSHDGVRWHNWSTLKDHSLWHKPLRTKDKLYCGKKSHSVYVTSDKVKGHPSIAFAPSESQNQ